METALETVPLQAELNWCLSSGRVFVRCGFYDVSIEHAAEGHVALEMRWTARGEPDRVHIARRALPARWRQYEPLFIAHLAAELLSRAIELQYEG